MNIDIKRDGENVCVSLDGWLNVESCEEFEKEMKFLTGCKNVVLDLEKVEYMSSAGLRQIVTFYKELSANKGELHIVNAAPAVMEVFKLTGIDKRLDIKAL